MEGWNGGRGSSWSYRHKIGSNVSSSSGTIVSNLSSAYTSSGSRLSTFSMEEAAMHFDSLGIHGASKPWGWEAWDRIRSLVMEFFSAPSSNCSIKRVDMITDTPSSVERWLKELGVDWLSSLDGASVWVDDLDMRISCWIKALDQITDTLCFRSELFPFSDCSSMGLPNICEEEGEPVADNSVPDRYHLVLFVKETMSKMLTFVDVLVAGDPNTIEHSEMLQVMYTELLNLLRVHDILSEASNKILTLSDSPTSVENEMVNLLSANKSKVSEVIRRTMEEIRIMSMEDGDGSPSPLDPQGSSDIHKVTRYVMTYIQFLYDRSRSVNEIMQGHVPCAENIRPVDNMIAEMVYPLKQKLDNISESFSDQGLKLLFLLNNSIEIQWRLQFNGLKGPGLLDVKHKIEGYMERYLQVSWEPLLSCLCNSTPLCLGKNYSLLSKFESEFQKICTTQMQWKVPEPELRRKLRQAIIDKIIPGYTEYIEDNEVTKPKFSPQELKSMLQELFEG